METSRAGPESPATLQSWARALRVWVQVNSREQTPSPSENLHASRSPKHLPARSCRILGIRCRTQGLCVNNTSAEGERCALRELDGHQGGKNHFHKGRPLTWAYCDSGFLVTLPRGQT